MSVDYQAIQEHIKAIDEQKAALLAQADELRAQATEQMVENVMKYIEDNGFSVREIMTKVQARITKKQKVTTFVNPENSEQTYTRGPLPEWIKEGMVAGGLDPADKAQVAQFKETLIKK
ncbi:MAG: H-NS histone family protein [Deltaproteobacteria bacterium]|nr:H-NS histone family protein [Deltaproteobacteria bacterium]